MEYAHLVGKRIKLIWLEGEPPNSPYINAMGKVVAIGQGCYGEWYMSGTWGGINVYINTDRYEVVD